MPLDYQDDDNAGFGLREVIGHSASIDASAGYSIPAAPFVIAPYRSLAVFVKPSGGGAFTVTVTWDLDASAGGATAEETQTSQLLQGETLVFRNQGIRVKDVTITGSADTAYAVMPSDVDPLPPKAALPFAHFYNLGGEPGIVTPAVFTGSDLNVSPHYQGVETWEINTNDASTFEVDPVKHVPLVKKQGVYLCMAQFTQSDRPQPPAGTGVPIAGLVAFGSEDGLGGGLDPAIGGPQAFPMAQTNLNGSNRVLATELLLNAYVYHEDLSGLDFLPITIQLFYAPAVDTQVGVGNWTVNIVRLSDGSINYFF